MSICCQLQPSARAAGEDDSDLAQLKSDVADIGREHRAKRTALKPFKAVGLTSTKCKDKLVYAYDDVASALSVARVDLIGAANKRSPALLDFVKDRFPVTPAAEEGALKQCFLAVGDVVLETKVQSTWNQIDSLLKSLDQMPTTVVTFDVQSTPSAQFTLTTASGIQKAQGFTVQTLSNIYRGLYSLTATAPGCKPASLTTINLVDTTPTRISCNLVATSAPDDSSCNVIF